MPCPPNPARFSQKLKRIAVSFPKKTMSYGRNAQLARRGILGRTDGYGNINNNNTRRYNDKNKNISKGSEVVCRYNGGGSGRDAGRCSYSNESSLRGDEYRGRGRQGSRGGKRGGYMNNNNNDNMSSCKRDGNIDSDDSGQKCRFFSEGSCRNGIHCGFRHVTQETKNDGNMVNDELDIDIIFELELLISGYIQEVYECGDDDVQFIMKIFGN